MSDRALTLDRNPAVCDMDSDLALRLLAYSDSLVDELGNLPGVVAFKPSDHLCRDRRCPVRVGLAPIYHDADHLTPAGADYVLRKLDSQSPGAVRGDRHPPEALAPHVAARGRDRRLRPGSAGRIAGDGETFGSEEACASGESGIRRDWFRPPSWSRSRSGPRC